MPSSDIFAKLNLKDQAEIVVLNAPESFEAELSRLRGMPLSGLPTRRARPSATSASSTATRAGGHWELLVSRACVWWP
jgi:hypothetical protein